MHMVTMLPAFLPATLRSAATHPELLHSHPAQVNCVSHATLTSQYQWVLAGPGELTMVVVKPAMSQGITLMVAIPSSDKRRAGIVSSARPCIGPVITK